MIKMKQTPQNGEKLHRQHGGKLIEENQEKRDVAPHYWGVYIPLLSMYLKMASPCSCSSF